MKMEQMIGIWVAVFTGRLVWNFAGLLLDRLGIKEAGVRTTIHADSVSAHGDKAVLH